MSTIISVGDNFITTKFNITSSGTTITSQKAVASIAIRTTDGVDLQLRLASTDTDYFPIVGGEVFSINVGRSKRESGGGATVTWNICHIQTAVGSSAPNTYVMVSYR